jgi:hypothetical protein
MKHLNFDLLGVESVADVCRSIYIIILNNNINLSKSNCLWHKAMLNLFAVRPGSAYNSNVISVNV